MKEFLKVVSRIFSELKIKILIVTFVMLSLLISMLGIKNPNFANNSQVTILIYGGKND